VSLTERLAQAEPALAGTMIAAARRGSWHAAARLLERIAPERWARREPGPASGPPDAFAELDELAARRRGTRPLP
jgi:hypothetical protein